MTKTWFLKNQLLQQLFAWLILFIIWFFLRYQDYSGVGTAIAITLVKVVDLAILIYVTNLILIPALLYKKRYGSLIFFFLIMIVCSSYLKMYITGQILAQPSFYQLTSANLKTRIYDNVLPHIFLVIAGAVVKLVYDQSLLRQRVVTIAKEKAETELQFLRSQINPHFLFNSLNAVYFLIDKNNADARNALHKFSEMLRYQLYDMEQYVSLEKEIAYIEDYIALQRLRKEDNLQIEVIKQGDLAHCTIAPLLLIPFVENAFKHLSHHSNRCIRLAISLINKELKFIISNSKATDVPPGIAGGIGLENVKRRLQLLYPDRHQLLINNEEDIYTVDLTISLTHDFS